MSGSAGAGGGGADSISGSVGAGEPGADSSSSTSGMLVSANMFVVVMIRGPKAGEGADRLRVGATSNKSAQQQKTKNGLVIDRRGHDNVLATNLD